MTGFGTRLCQDRRRLELWPDPAGTIAKAAENADAWRRTNASNAAKIQGVIEGLGLDDDFKRDFIKNTSSKTTRWRPFSKRRTMPTINSCALSLTVPKRGLEQAKLDTEFNDKYRVAQQHVAGIQTMQYEAFADRFWKTSPDGEAGYASALNWRKGVAQMTQDMLASVSQFRDFLVGKPFSERQAAWEQFKPQYLQMWRDRAAANLEGSNALYKSREQPPEVLNQTVADVQQQVQAKQAEVQKQTEAAAQSVRGVGSKYGLATADENGHPVPGADIHLLNAIRKFGAPDARNIRSLSDATPEMAENALANRQHIIDAQVRSTANSNHRAPAKK